MSRRRSPATIFLTAAAALVAALLLAAHYWLAVGWLPAYVAAINLVTLGLYGYDKSAARSGSLRTPETTLHLLAFAGGSPSALLAQRIFRHKTAKRSFQVTFWLILIVQAGLLVWYLWPR